MRSKQCEIGNLTLGNGKLVVIAGPCMAESKKLCLTVADHMQRVCAKLDIGFIFKASYDKANRSSASGYRGPGMETGLDWLAEIKRKFAVPVLSDVHETAQAKKAAKVLDCIQIPAFLCRQTDLLVAAAETGKAINIKKGQFMAPWDMKNAVEKIISAGNRNVTLTERGTSFGYNRLITDFRAIPEMRRYAPVIFDATHSVQEPGGLGNASGGQRQYAPMLACAAITCGADALFVETHPNPDKALSDAASQIPLDEMEQLLKRSLAIFDIIRDNG